MERVAIPLRAMGAAIETREGTAPLAIGGGRALRGIDYTLPVASAQLKSALLLAGLWARAQPPCARPDPAVITPNACSRPWAWASKRTPITRTSLTGPARPGGRDLEVPGDFSSAAFFLVAGLLAADDALVIRDVGVNPTRTGLLEILRRMGGRIELKNLRNRGGEPVAELVVRRSELRGVEVGPALAPLTIDEFPVLFIAAACARAARWCAVRRSCVTRKAGLSVMAEGLRALGISVEESVDGLTVQGGALSAGRIDSHGDHRVAMAFAVAGLAANGPVEVLRTEQVSTSFPGFLSVAARGGLAVESRETDA